MSGFDYSRAKATADRMIARYGQIATLRRPTASGPAYNPTPGGPVDYDVTVVVTSYSAHEIAESGGRVLATDRKVLLAAGNLSITPRPSDKLMLGGEVCQIVGPDEGRGIQTAAPGGVTVLYELHCRR